MKTKPLTIFIFLFVISGCCFQFDDDSEDSIYISPKYPNGKIRYKGLLKDGKYEEEWIWYTQEGHRYAKGVYREGERWHGIFPVGMLSSVPLVGREDIMILEYINGVLSMDPFGHSKVRDSMVKGEVN